MFIFDRSFNTSSKGLFFVDIVWMRNKRLTEGRESFRETEISS